MDKTSKLGLNLPEKGLRDWDVPINENFSLIDAADAQNVKLTGYQNIGGVKRFHAGHIEIQNTGTSFAEGITGQCYVNFWTGDNKQTGYINSYLNASTTSTKIAAVGYDAEGKQKAWGLNIFRNLDGSEGYATLDSSPATNDSSIKIATTANVDAKIAAQAVKLSGNQTIGDIKTFTSVVTRSHEFTGGSAKTLTDVDTNGKGSIAIIPYYTGNKIYHRTYAENTTSGKHAYLDVTVDDSGVAGLHFGGSSSTFNVNFANATQVTIPTPATSDNSTKAATTAFVNNKFQVVSALPSSPTAGVFYFIKES